MLDSLIALSARPMQASTLAEATDAFHAALLPHGVTYLQSRLYRRPREQLTAEAHWNAGGVVRRHARPGWIGGAAHRYICFDNNPLLEPIRRGTTRYRFSDYAAHGDRHFSAYWEAMGEGDIAEALCATAYGKDRQIASLHIGFARTSFVPGEAESIQMAGMMLCERFIDELGQCDDLAVPSLTPRERDVMAYVAEGKTDWEIGRILSVSEATARFHVDNARRKLGAANRAHAVARFLALGGL